MKTVKLLKERNGDPVGGKVTLPDDVANDLVATGVATADLGVTTPKAAEPVTVPPVAPVVPKAEYDHLKNEFDSVQKGHAELQKAHDALTAVAKEFEADNAALEADNKKLADEVKGLKAELAKKVAVEKKP